MKVKFFREKQVFPIDAFFPKYINVCRDSNGTYVCC